MELAQPSADPPFRAGVVECEVEAVVDDVAEEEAEAATAHASGVPSTSTNNPRKSSASGIENAGGSTRRRGSFG